MNKKWAYIFAILMSASSVSVAMSEGNKAVTTRSSQSVLSKGSWAKVKVATSGVYILTNSALSQMGFSDPSKVAVFGNGGAQLPYASNRARIDDLCQLPVVRVQNGILFYAEGVETWTNSSNSSKASVNRYSNYAYYFITDSNTDGVVPSGAPDVAEAVEGGVELTTYSSRYHYENNAINLQKSGREWYGEELTSSRSTVSYNLELPARASADDNIRLAVAMVSSTSSTMTYAVKFNGDDVASGTFEPNAENTCGRTLTRNLTFKSSNTKDNKVTISMGISSVNDHGYIDYLTLLSKSKLDMSGLSQLSFRNVDTTAVKNVSYVISNAPSGTVVWDVTTPTAPVSMPAKQSGTTLKFGSAGGYEREYVVFNTQGSFSEPSFVSKVNNQNLHALKGVNYVIITCDDFLAEAQRLADAHKSASGISVAVATCQQIYNEFSSGRPDVSALRDFVKMIYDRGKKGEGDKLYNVLLFGQGSYDNITESVNNRLLTYQSSNSLSTTQSYVTDDFFGWLDDTEGGNDSSGRLDVGVGRFPCSTVEQARALVDKSIIYLTGLDKGEWKATYTLAGDDGDQNEHMLNTEQLAQRVEALHPDMLVKRIYLETYMPQQSSTGISYPGAHQDFMNAINNGSLVVNYVGHAASYALSGDGLFEQKHISQFVNKTHPTLLITAACDFAPFDHNIYSASEEGLIYSNGGFIGVLASSRLVYSTSNHRLNINVIDYLLQADADGHDYSIAEAISKGKVAAGSLVNSLKYVYLGDPAIVLCRRRLNVVTDSVNGQAKEFVDMPLTAASLSSIAGSVRSDDGRVVDTFNGTVSITLYDKKVTTKTNGTKSDITEFEEYKSPIYKGTAEVVNGHFNLDFILSKDIDFEVGYGRTFYYAVADNASEAYGADSQMLIGGIADNVSVDTIGPAITAWIDYTQYKSGQLAGSSPVLYAIIADPSGINTTGLGVGHDICVYINDDRNNAICLNSYFVYDAGSHTSGKLTYQLSNVDDGLKRISIKAWDNMNNSSVKTLDVRVVKGGDITFGLTELYPNPLSSADDALKLRFSHNDGGNAFDITARVYSINGQQMAVRTFSAVSAANQIDVIDLSAEMPEISCLAKGMYVVKFDVNSSSGRKGSFVKRLAISVDK